MLKCFIFQTMNPNIHSTLYLFPRVKEKVGAMTEIVYSAIEEVSTKWEFDEGPRPTEGYGYDPMSTRYHWDEAASSVLKIA